MTIAPITDDLSDVRAELRDVARQLVARHAGDDAALWRAAAGAGWFGLEVAAADGGAGVTSRESCVVLEELGRALAPGAVTTAIAVGVPALAVLSAPAQRAEVLPPVLAGSLRPAVALCDRNGGFDARLLGVVAVAVGDRVELTGAVPFVPDVTSADVVVVPATDAGALGWYRVAADASGVTVTATDTVDRSRAVGELRLDGTVAERLSGVTDAAAAYRWLLQRGALAAAADSLGVARVAASIAVEYAQQRRQFGRAIGSFQAIKHRCVDMFVGIEAAAVALDVAAEQLPSVDNGWSEWTSIAKIQCGDTASSVTTEAVQVLGGVGFTWDHVMHRYVKRALMNDAMYGTAASHRTRLAASLAG
ncbi:MAG TPA: acyl-CoA dehydrogenase family protein [Ilumatobacter sp.]|nr:acyl-CoA dehydrogenase family protein [Ilumatobacter sp.]